MALLVGQLYGELNIDRSKFKSGLKDAHSDFEGFGSGLLGKAALLGAGLGAAIGGVEILKKIAEIGIGFQDMGNTFQSVTSATSKQMAEMSAKAIELGNDLTLPTTSAQDAETAMTELAKGGLSVAESMAAAKGVLQLSTAAVIDTGQAATYTADALNTFHLHGKDAVMVADLLAGAANASSGGITDMAQSLQQAGSVFAAAHVPIQDVVTLVAEMAQNGIKGSDAGTSLKTMMLALQTPVGEQVRLMKSLNLNLYDSHGQMRNFRDIIKDVQGPLSKLTQAERDHALGVIFGSDAVRAGNIIFGQGVDAFDKMKTAVTKEGSAADVAAAQSRGLGGALRGLQSQAETLALQIFQQASPALEGMARALSDNMPRAIAIGSKALGELGARLKDGAGIAKPFADEYIANMQRAAKDSKPELDRLKKDVQDLGETMRSFARSEAFATLIATFTVLVPAAFRPTLAGLNLMIDQFRIASTALFGLVRVTTDIFRGDWKAAWKDASDTVKTELENQDRLFKDSGAFVKATQAATSDDVLREYERMKAQTLVATNGMKEDTLHNATQTRIEMGIAARATGTEYSGGVASGMRAGGTQVIDASVAVVNDAVARAHDAASGAGEVGKFLAQGIAYGIANNAGFISSAAIAATRNAVREASGPAGAMASSPSKLSAREVGLPLAQGVAAGIMQGYGHVASAAHGLAKPFRSALAGMPSLSLAVPSMAGAGVGAANSPAGAVHITQNFYGSTADHQQMFQDAAWAARSRLSRPLGG